MRRRDAMHSRSCTARRPCRRELRRNDAWMHWCASPRLVAARRNTRFRLRKDTRRELTSPVATRWPSHRNGVSQRREDARAWLMISPPLRMMRAHCSILRGRCDDCCCCVGRGMRRSVARSEDTLACRTMKLSLFREVVVAEANLGMTLPLSLRKLCTEDCDDDEDAQACVQMCTALNCGR